VERPGPEHHDRDDAAERLEVVDQRGHGGGALLLRREARIEDELPGRRVRASLRLHTERRPAHQPSRQPLVPAPDDDGAVAIKRGEVEGARAETGEPLAHRERADPRLAGRRRDRGPRRHQRGSPEDDLGTIDLPRQCVARQHALEVAASSTRGDGNRERAEHLRRRVFAVHRPLRQPQLDATTLGAPATRQERVPLAWILGRMGHGDGRLVRGRMRGEYVDHRARGSTLG
jgi:hypothetical protein